MITTHMVDEALRRGVIKIEDQNGVPICRIGEYWFWFAGQEGETAGSTTNYLLDSSRQDVIRQIFETICDLASYSPHEFSYYEWYLKEQLNYKTL